MHKDDVVFDILSLYVENLFNYLMVNDIDCSEGCLLKLVASHEPLSKQTWKCYSKGQRHVHQKGLQARAKIPFTNNTNLKRLQALAINPFTNITQILEVLASTCSAELALVYG